MRRAINSSGLIIGMLLFSLGQAAAQQTRQSSAEQLRAQAVALQQDRAELVPAARLYLREAALRGNGDPQSVKCLTIAAHLLYYGNRREEALRVMEHAAESARARGDVAIAAQTYLLAAWIAQTDQKPAAVLRLAHAAKLLAGSPLLATAERNAIVARVHGISAVGLR